MTLDEFLTEMMGECWHEPVWNRCETCKDGRYGTPCSKCGNRVEPTEPYHPDFSTPADAYRLMQWVMTQEWWREFSEAMFHKFCHDFNTTEWNQMGFVKWLFSDPDRFATLVAEYRGWHERIS